MTRHGVAALALLLLLSGPTSSFQPPRVPQAATSSSQSWKKKEGGLRSTQFLQPTRTTSVKPPAAVPPRQTQVQLVHSQLPVSQQPQQSHLSQPAFWPLMVAGTKANAAMRIRLFMGKILCIGTLNRSLHVTTCEHGKAIADVHPYRGTYAHGRESTKRWPIQFRQTPQRIRMGRIGTASEAATYSRLTPRVCGASKDVASAITPRPSRSCPGDVPEFTDSGWSCLASSRQRQGGSVVSAGQAVQHS
jgi:hypothetical protein